MAAPPELWGWWGSNEARHRQLQRRSADTRQMRDILIELTRTAECACEAEVGDLHGHPRRCAVDELAAEITEIDGNDR